MAPYSRDAPHKKSFNFNWFFIHRRSNKGPSFKWKGKWLYIIQRSFVSKGNEKSESIIEIIERSLDFTVLNDVDSCFLKVLPIIARISEVHPKKPFHSLNMHYTMPEFTTKKASIYNTGYYIHTSITLNNKGNKNRQLQNQ